MSKQCKCKKGYLSKWDSKCANCRTKDETKAHNHALDILSKYRIDVVNKHHKKVGEYVGRGSPLGNPFTLTTHKREEAIYAYDNWLYDQLERVGNTDVAKELDRLLNLLLANKTLTLVCFCAPKSCHADVIKDLIHKYMYTYIRETGDDFS